MGILSPAHNIRLIVTVRIGGDTRDQALDRAEDEIGDHLWHIIDDMKTRKVNRINYEDEGAVICVVCEELT